MDDAELAEEGHVPMSVGERLREAREAAGLSLEDIATSTRIPTRHLESLEASDFSRLPAPTYTVGFAKNFAGAVGLDRVEIGEQLRAEMGGTRPTSTTAEVFEPADPARAMPKWLIIGAIGGILLVVLLFNWLNNRSLEEPDAVAQTNESITGPQQPAQPAQPAPQAQGPVVLTATDRVWLEVKDGAVSLKQGELAAGETFQVPANAVQPTLTTAKAEALRITVGTTIAPPVGPPAEKITVSLKPDDLLRPRSATAPAVVQPAAAAPAATQPARTAPTRRAATPPAPPAQAATPPATNVVEPAANTQ
jgi:cytoskeletal protein RodZ